jgi:uncharacterized protein (DUF2225 family)
MSDPLWLKDVKCPACDAAFKTVRVKSSALKVKSIDTDFHKTYEGVSPLLYAVTVCPECNFAARNDDFDKAQIAYQKEVLALSKAIKSSGKNVRFPEETKTDSEEAVKKHLLAIAFARHFKPENPNTISGLYMHIVWLYREEGNHERELEYMNKALEYYIKTFEKGTFVPEKIGVVGIMYLIGEMYRMLGNYNDAVMWFSRTVKNKEIEGFPNIEHLTRDAWEKINEEKRKNNG